MKKSLLSVGAAIAAVGMLTGCSSLEQQEPGAYLKELNTFMDKATGLENHKRQAENHLLPNASLSSSKASYVAVAGASLDAIELRFGKADELYVAKAMTDPNYLGEWNALRNADKDKDAAAAAEKTLKGVASDAYAQYKTRNKKSIDELYASVIGAVAQTDYLFYKKQIAAGKATAEDYKDQKSWLELGKKNIVRVFNEEKKVMDARAKKVAAAEKEAKADWRKNELVIKYNAAKLAVPGIKLGTAELRKQLSGVLPPPIINTCCGILEKELIEVMEKQMADAEKEWPGVKTAVKDSFEPYTMPKFDATGINAFNATSKISAYVKDTGSSLNDWQKKQFAPYIYAVDMAIDRLGFTVKAWAWSYDSYKAYKEAAEE